MNTPDAPDPRKVAEAALEAFVYVPLGLALEARDLVPKLAQRGRNQVVLARLGARFAVQRAEAEAERLVKRMQDAAGRGGDTATPSPATTSTTATPAPSTVLDESPPVAEAMTAPDADAPAAPAGEGGEAPARPARRTTVRATSPAPTASSRRASGARAARPAAAEAPGEEPAAAAPALAIPGYDTLSASQVIPRLDALRPDELEAVRRHEADHRARRTILSRIAQLQS